MLSARNPGTSRRRRLLTSLSGAALVLVVGAGCSGSDAPSDASGQTTASAPDGSVDPADSTVAASSDSKPGTSDTSGTTDPSGTDGQPGSSDPSGSDPATPGSDTPGSDEPGSDSTAPVTLATLPVGEPIEVQDEVVHVDDLSASCDEAVGPLRELIARNPSSYLITEEEAAIFNVVVRTPLAEVDGEAPCTVEEFARFNANELQPWLSLPTE